MEDQNPEPPLEGYSAEDIACIPDVKSSTSGIPDVVGRYYYQYVTPNGEQYLYQHTNHICVVGLAKEHPIIKEGKTVKSVNFKSGKFDYSQIEVSGKAKKVQFATLSPKKKTDTVTLAREDSGWNLPRRFVRSPVKMGQSIPFLLRFARG